MAAKRPARRKPARRKAPARRRTTTTATRRKHPARRVKIPRKGPLHARLGTWFILRVVVPAIDTRRDDVRSRKDAAIERLSHEGCPKCGGQGQITVRGKNGEFRGSKSCTAPPTKRKVSKWAVHKEARFGTNKRTGLVGWTCPCGKKERPRYRDAKLATQALRAHEKAAHGSKTVGGGLNFQAGAPTDQPQTPKQPPSLQTKTVTDSGMTDEQWIKQNKSMPVGKAIAAGKCWQCAGNGKLYSAFGGQQAVVVCGECKGSGKAPKATTKAGA